MVLRVFIGILLVMFLFLTVLLHSPQMYQRSYSDRGCKSRSNNNKMFARCYKKYLNVVAHACARRRELRGNRRMEWEPNY
jgi:hypothetical protein